MIGLRLNNYELVSVLGEGGMGTVYLARHTFTGRKAAVKLLHPQLAQDQVLVTRFMNEARATTAIGHPNTRFSLPRWNRRGVAGSGPF